MLSVFGSIASILGLCVQGYEKLKKSYKGKGGEALVALKVLSQSVAAWKKIHQSYHSINKELSTVLPLISNYHDGYESVKDVDDINSSNLKGKFTNGMLSIAVSSFKNDNLPYINTLTHQLNNSKAISEDEINKLRNEGHTALSESLEKIKTANGIVLTTHTKFVEFLDKIHTFRRLERWQSEQKEYILSVKYLIKEDVPEIIYETDKVLMTMLGFYENILNEVN